MTSKNITIFLLIGALVSVLALNKTGTAKSGNAKAPKTGVVSMRQILGESKKNRNFEAKLSEEAQQVKSELSELEKQIQSAREVLNALKPTSSDYSKRSKDLMEMEVRYEAKKQYFQQDLSRKQQIWAEESFKGILKVIEKVAKSKGLDMVLAKEDYLWPAQNSNELMLVIKTSKVLYSSDDLDITGDVLEVWNNTPTDF